MALRMRRPDTVRLALTDNEWLVVKKDLTAGDVRERLSRMIRYRGDERSIDPVKVGLSTIVAYLLDWSVTDADGRPVSITEQPSEFIEAALNALPPEAFAEILEAIETHETAMEEARKNESAGGTTQSAISPSAA